MTTRMLIDARHPEETRVAVVQGNRIEEFDFESAEHKQLKGNIYLAKVTRVEPSLQAAFVDYGGNRHGFLAFSEIHPDYYQIPKSDREALLREEAEHAAEEERLRAEAEDEPLDPHHEDDGSDDRPEEPEGEEEESDSQGDPEDGERARRGRRTAKDEAADEVRRKRLNLRRRYKIQDVIQRRQVLLVQVVKEERGNKGAALTTYLSLAGRYCVLMPNTSHGGGISRKISNGSDRKRLKSIIADLKLPSTMGLIVRTAGLERTKTEIMAAIEAGQALGRDLPIMVSMTLTDLSGRNLSGHTVEAFWHAVRHARPLTIGLNCSFGAEQLRPHIKTLSGVADTLIMAYPNAGLPNELGQYDEAPETTAALVREWAAQGQVNVLGGCCGSTPAHIRAIAGAVRDLPPRAVPTPEVRTRLAGLEPFTMAA